MAGKTLGHIDCPSCGTQNGMRITHDRNGKPFGFCEAKCAQQLRVGGNAFREAEFIKRYPWAAGEVVENTPTPKLPKPVTATVTAPTPAPAPAAAAPAPAPAKRPTPAPAPAPVPETTPEPSPMSNMARALASFGITK